MPVTAYAENTDTTNLMDFTVCFGGKNHLSDSDCIIDLLFLLIFFLNSLPAFADHKQY